MEQKKNKAELLAPAGSMETLKAVFQAGADAVYGSGEQFGARAYANNFTREELLYAIDYAHIHGKKFYLTVNTLLKQQEVEESLYHYILPLYKQGLDGAILQDFGVFRFFKQYFPGVELHASTQMSITGPMGAALLKEMGCSRIVTARELSLREIKRIREEVEIEIESFIHGALCYCYSGQCLFSSMLGERSGNRGRCAQPCRLPYTAENGTKGHLLSTKDLCTIELLPEILESGVYSLKIEGRMKQKEYAAGVTSIYREYLDRYLADPMGRYQVDPRDLKYLEELGSRSGFTKGYYQMRNGASMITVEKPSHTKAGQDFFQGKDFLFQDSKKKILGELSLFPGTPACFVLQADDIEVCVMGEEVQEATKRPMTRENVQEKISKTGESFFEFQNLKIHMGEDIFLPVSSLNQLRRQGMAELQEALLKSFRRDSKKEFIGEVMKKQEKISPYLAVSVSSLEQLSIVLSYDFIQRIYVDCSMFSREEEWVSLEKLVKQVHEKGKKVYYQMPSVFREDTILWYRNNGKSLGNMGVDGFVVGNYEAFSLIREIVKAKPTEKKIEILADSSLYVWSSYAYQNFLEAGISQVTLPLEANQKELRNRLWHGGEMVIYGHLPLMVSAQCVTKTTEGCKKKSGFTLLTDRYEKAFPIKTQCKDCYNVIYNTKPLSLLHMKEEVETVRAEGYRISFTIEKKKQMQKVLEYYDKMFLQNEKIPQSEYLLDFTKGHFKRGVE